MRTAFLILLATSLFLWAVLIPSPPVPTATPLPAAQESAHPEGLFFLGDGRTLLLRQGQFVMRTASATAPTLVRGTVRLNDSGQLVFHSELLDAACNIQVHEGHLWMSVMRREGASYIADSCHPWLLPLTDSFPSFQQPAPISWEPGRPAPDGVKQQGDLVLTRWSVDLGSVGLFPAKNVSGVGGWVSESDGASLTVSVDSGKSERPQWMGIDRSRMEWRPDAEGISSVIGDPHPPANHMDWKSVVTFAPLGPDRAMLSTFDGCRRRTRLEFFRRVSN